ncbi:MAG: ATP-binding protein [Candidatus Dormibacteria bacterium]
MSSIQVLAAELVSSLEPREIILRLVERALDVVPADRCTLTSVDQFVLRVEGSFERGKGRPSWLGSEYDLSYIDQQPLIAQAVRQGRIAVGQGFASQRIDPELQPDLEGMRHTAVIPLALGDDVMAMLILSRRDEEAFSQVELERLQEIGVLAILALRNARLYQDVNEARGRGLEALTLISQHLASSDELPTFFGKMSASVAQLVNADKAAFWMVQGDELVAQAEAFGFASAVLEQMRVPVDHDLSSPLARLLFGGEALGGLVTPEVLTGRYAEALRAMDVREVVAVPWKTAEVPLGMLFACNAQKRFTAEDQWVMRVAARASAVVWQGYEAERRLVALQAKERANLQRHAARMAELEQLKSQFLRLASHELRTPLTIVRGYISMFEEGVFGHLSEEARKILPTISARVAQMNLLIDQMMNTARLEDSRMAISAKPVRVDDLARRVAASFQGLLGRDRRLLVETMHPGVTAFADPEKVETIIGNLVSNAIKYSPSGGDVRCVIELSGKMVTVTVVDTGIGIHAEDMVKLFQRFGRLERPETANIEGTGLGLYLSRELARLQGGEIDVESTVGEGSRFRLTLPTEAPDI